MHQIQHLCTYLSIGLHFTTSFPKFNKQNLIDFFQPAHLHRPTTLIFLTLKTWSTTFKLNFQCCETWIYFVDNCSNWFIGCTVDIEWTTSNLQLQLIKITCSPRWTCRLSSRWKVLDLFSFIFLIICSLSNLLLCDSRKGLCTANR